MITLSDADLFDRVRLFHPYTGLDLVFGRTAVRSDAFSSSSASGDQQVIIGAAAGFDDHDVRRRARGELIERTGNILNGRAAEQRADVIASYHELRRAGRPAVDPVQWADAPASSDPRGMRMMWVEAESLTGDGHVLVPASVVFLHHRPPAGCGMLLRATSAGLSAHTGRDPAIAHALLEVLERDLLWRAWYSGESRPAPVDLEPSPPLRRVLAALELDHTLLAVSPNDDLWCVIACLHRPDRTEQTFGAKCMIPVDSRSWHKAVEAALLEAVMVRWSMTSPVAVRAWQRFQASGGDRSPENPLEHALLAYHERDGLAELLGIAREESVGPSATTERKDTPTLAQDIAALTGQDVLFVDTTAPAPSQYGMSVARVVAPGARRLPTAEPTADRPHPFG
ncbi:YcaO-like family protein [Nonomuraea sp. NPDC050536]|uniref:YcaO-like family protein n=1 Tax=Nonomuraea sp. NPDC050536 TaxID=3364366 RepID=UPI0037C651F6